MSLSVHGKKKALDSLAITHVGAHSAYPNDSGSNEISGGSPAYARQAITWATATAGTLTATTSPVINVSATSDVYWIGGWSASTGGEMRARWPLGGTAKEYRVTATDNFVHATGHGYSDAQTVVFYGDSAPGGITAGTVYYVRDSATDAFKVATTAGGAVVDITTAPDGRALVSKITANTGDQRTITISSLTLHLNF